MFIGRCISRREPARPFDTRGALTTLRQRVGIFVSNDEQGSQTMHHADPPEGLRDLGYERQRLTQSIKDRQYDPARLAELGRLSFEMGDLFHAQVEAVVDYFARRCRDKPMSILSHAPSKALRIDLSAHDPVVRARLERLGITGEDIRSRIEPTTARVSRLAKVWEVMLVVAAIAGVACFLLGAVIAAQHLFEFVDWLMGW